MLPLIVVVVVVAMCSSLTHFEYKRFEHGNFVLADVFAANNVYSRLIFVHRVEDCLELYFVIPTCCTDIRLARASVRNLSPLSASLIAAVAVADLLKRARDDDDKTNEATIEQRQQARMEKRHAELVLISCRVLVAKRRGQANEQADERTNERRAYRGVAPLHQAHTYVNKWRRLLRVRSPFYLLLLSGRAGERADE